MISPNRGAALLSGTLALAAAAVLPAAGCSARGRLKPVTVGTGTWERSVNLPLLRARFNIRTANKFYRDDGIFDGDLSIHTQELERDLDPGSLSPVGQPAEGLVTEGRRRDGASCTVIYGATTGDRVLDRGRREMLRAAAVIRLGMREGLEDYFRQVGVKVQFKPLSDRMLAKLVEAYALAKLNFPYVRITDPETQQMAQLLVGLGIGYDERPPIGSRRRSR
jgi:hypothetical protein